MYNANLPKPEESGWIVNTDQNYSVDWEDSNVQAKIRKNRIFSKKVFV